MVFPLIGCGSQFRGLRVGPLFYYNTHHIYSDYRILLVPFSYLVPLKRQSVQKSNVSEKSLKSRRFDPKWFDFASYFPKRSDLCIYKGLKPIYWAETSKNPKIGI